MSLLKEDVAVPPQMCLDIGYRALGMLGMP